MSDQQILADIRSATKEQHENLEKGGILKRLMEPDITVAEYGQYLQKTLVLQEAIEKTVFPVLSGIVPDLEQRHKVSLLKHDLNVLGVDHTELSVFFDSSYSTDPAFNMGLMYVTEGSTLGGMVILKNLKTVLGDAISPCSSFLNAYGQKTGPMWKVFVETLTNYSSILPAEQKQRILNGAVYGFERTALVFEPATSV